MQAPSTTAIQAHRLVLVRSKLDELRRAHGIESDTDLALRLGVNKTTLYRVSTGRTTPSNEFIAGIKVAFPLARLDDLFVVERIPAERAA